MNLMHMGRPYIFLPIGEFCPFSPESLTHRRSGQIWRENIPICMPLMSFQSCSKMVKKKADFSPAYSPLKYTLMEPICFIHCHFISLLYFSLCTVFTCQAPGQYFRNEQPIDLNGATCAAATDYTKKPHVFRLKLPNGGEWLFQCRDDVRRFSI